MKGKLDLNKTIPLTSVSPKLQDLARRVLKAENAVLTATSTLGMASDYLQAVKASVQELIQKEQEEIKQLGKVKATP